MKKILLAVGLLAACLSSSAQKVFEYGFETPSSELTPQKLEYINFKGGDSRDTIAEGRNGGLALKLMNVDSIVGNSWERAIKIRTLGLQENTPYRVSFWMKGSQVYGASNTATNVHTRLMVGRENADVPLVATGNAAYDYNSTSQDSLNWKKYTYLFFYSKDSIQQAYFKTQKPDSVYNNDHFLCLNIYNPGKYFLDDILIEQSSIRGFTFNGYNIKVDFGYGVNFANVYNGSDYNIVKLPNECVTVKYDGVETEVLSVEVQQSGLIIFLANQLLTAEDADKISISFNNPTDPKFELKYNDAKRPFSWDPTSDMRVLNFTDEMGGVFDENLLPESVDYLAPFLKKATPENKSFDLPLTSRTFELEYTQNIDVSKAVARLEGPGINTTLTLAETGFSRTLTYSVPSSIQLVDGQYRLTVSNISSENEVVASKADVIEMDYGVAAEAKIDTPVYTANWAASGIGDNSAPYGWKLRQTNTGTVYSGATGGLSFMSRVRTFTAGGNFDRGLYIGSRGGDPAHFWYGDVAGYPLHLKAGKHALSLFITRWKSTVNTAGKLNILLKDTVVKDTVFITNNLLTGPGHVNGANNVLVTDAAYREFTIMVPRESDYILDFYSNQGSWDEHVFGNIKMVSVPSNAVLYKNLLNVSMGAANVVKTSLDSFIYNGPDKTNLQSSIEYYSAFTSTSPSAYTNAASALNAVVSTASAHKTLVDNYFTVLNNSKNVIKNNVGNYYSTMPIYSKLVDIIAAYDTTIIQLSNNSAVTTAKDSLTYYYNYMQGNINATTPLKFRINKSVTLAESLPIRVPAADLQAAKSVYVDDDAIANQLNQTLKTYIEANIADTMVFVKDTAGTNIATNYPALKSYIDMTGYIKNPNFYTKEKTERHLSDTLFPGWKTELIRGNPEVIHEAKMATNVNPVVSSYVVYFSPGTALKMYQDVVNLPNGRYTLGFTTRMPTNWNGLQDGNPILDPSGKNWTLETIADSMGIFAISGDSTYKAAFYAQSNPGADNFGGLSLNTYINDIMVTDGKLTIGVRNYSVPVFTPTIFWGNPILRMSGKDPNTIYVNPVKNVQNAAAVKEVQYFNIQGARLSAPAKGLNIVKTIYSNGASKVEKFMIK